MENRVSWLVNWERGGRLRGKEKMFGTKQRGGTEK